MNVNRWILTGDEKWRIEIKVQQKAKATLQIWHQQTFITVSCPPEQTHPQLWVSIFNLLLTDFQLSVFLIFFFTLGSWNPFLLLLLLVIGGCFSLLETQTKSSFVPLQGCDLGLWHLLWMFD
ncbi:hypothetical protein V6N11_013116 [Hibiscus sabdariffa]|uniref:Uncharacterized protein n=2 Tax=Hibiscus sabdariffa TaxID=183260 RepID=A0ABR2A9U2_9ROSI